MEIGSASLTSPQLCRVPGSTVVAPSCVICLGQMTDGLQVNTKCGHVFHAHCILTSVEHNPKCPTCRTKCDSDTLVPLHYEHEDPKDDDAPSPSQPMVLQSSHEPGNVRAPDVALHERSHPTRRHDMATGLNDLKLATAAHVSAYSGVCWFGRLSLSPPLPRSFLWPLFCYRV